MTTFLFCFFNKAEHIFDYKTTLPPSKLALRALQTRIMIERLRKSVYQFDTDLSDICTLAERQYYRLSAVSRSQQIFYPSYRKKRERLNTYLLQGCFAFDSKRPVFKYETMCTKNSNYLHTKFADILLGMFKQTAIPLRKKCFVGAIFNDINIENLKYSTNRQLTHVADLSIVPNDPVFESFYQPTHPVTDTATKICTRSYHSRNQKANELLCKLEKNFSEIQDKDMFFGPKTILEMDSFKFRFESAGGEIVPKRIEKQLDSARYIVPEKTLKHLPATFDADPEVFQLSQQINRIHIHQLSTLFTVENIEKRREELSQLDFAECSPSMSELARTYIRDRYAPDCCDCDLYGLTAYYFHLNKYRYCRVGFSDGELVSFDKFQFHSSFPKTLAHQQITEKMLENTVRFLKSLSKYSTFRFSIEYHKSLIFRKSSRATMRVNCSKVFILPAYLRFNVFDMSEINVHRFFRFNQPRMNTVNALVDTLESRDPQFDDRSVTPVRHMDPFLAYEPSEVEFPPEVPDVIANLIFTFVGTTTKSVYKKAKYLTDMLRALDEPEKDMIIYYSSKFHAFRAYSVLGETNPSPYRDLSKADSFLASDKYVFSIDRELYSFPFKCAFEPLRHALMPILPTISQAFGNGVLFISAKRNLVSLMSRNVNGFVYDLKKPHLIDCETILQYEYAFGQTDIKSKILRKIDLNWKVKLETYGEWVPDLQVQDPLKILKSVRTGFRTDNITSTSKLPKIDRVRSCSKKSISKLFDPNFEKNAVSNRNPFTRLPEPKFPVNPIKLRFAEVDSSSMDFLDSIGNVWKDDFGMDGEDLDPEAVHWGPVDIETAIYPGKTVII